MNNNIQNCLNGPYYQVRDRSSFDQRPNASFDQESDDDEDDQGTDLDWLVYFLSKFPDFQSSMLTIIKNKIDLKVLEAIIADNPHIFQTADETVLLRPQLKICAWYLSSRGCSAKASRTCSDMHICPQYICGSCRDSSCPKGHQLLTKHNSRVLKVFHLNDIDLSVLRKILKISLAEVNSNEDQEPLIMCESYNKGKCSNRNCKHFHFCEYHLKSNLSCRNRNCILNHDFNDSDCKRTLENKGIDTNETPKDIMIEILKAFPGLLGKQTSSKSQSPDSSRSPSPTPRQNPRPNQPYRGIMTTEASEFYGNIPKPEICNRSLKNRCKSLKCPRLHSDLPFHWQISHDGNDWFNLSKNQVLHLEKQYCDPNIDKTELPEPKSKNAPQKLVRLLSDCDWEADFKKMEVKSRNSRTSYILRDLRLENEADTFTWYFLDGNSTWVQYGEVDTTQRAFLKSKISSHEIEQHYIQNPRSPMTFKNDLFSYELDFIHMTQTNTSTKSTRPVKRRPVPHKQSFFSSMIAAPASYFFG